MFATEIDDNTTVSHSVRLGEYFDGQVAYGATPWGVVGDHLASGDTLTLDAVSWLVENDCTHHDIGRFPRRSGVAVETIKKVQDALPENEGDNLRLGYIVENPPRPLPEKVPTFKVWHRVELPAGDPHTASLAIQAWKILEDFNDPAELFVFGDTLSMVKAHAIRRGHKATDREAACLRPAPPD